MGRLPALNSWEAEVLEAARWEWAINAHTLSVAMTVLKHAETCPFCGQDVTGVRVAEKAAAQAEWELQGSPITETLWV